MTSMTTVNVTYSASYTTTEPAALGGVQAVAPPPVSATATSPAVTSARVPLLQAATLLIDDPKVNADPEALTAALQLWAASFMEDVVKATENQLSISNTAAKQNLKDSLDKLEKSIEKMQEAKRAARKARTLGIIAKVVAVVVAAAVLGALIAGSGGAGAAAAPLAPKIILGVMAGAGGLSALVDLGGEIEAAHNNKEQAFSIARHTGNGWGGLLSGNVAQATLEYYKWVAKQNGHTLSDDAVLGLTVALTVAQLAATAGLAGASSSANALQTGAGFAAAGGSITGGSLAISQGALTIEGANYLEESEKRRADSTEIDARIQQIQTFIQDTMQYAQKANEQLQSAASVTAQYVEEWGGSMSRLAMSSREKAAMA